MQSWLGNYFKGPAARDGETVSNDLHVQLAQLEAKLSGWLG